MSTSLLPSSPSSPPLPSSPSIVTFTVCIRERQYVIRIPSCLPSNSPSFLWLSNVALQLYLKDHAEIPPSLLIATNVIDSNGNICFGFEKTMERCSAGETITVEIGGPIASLGHHHHHNNPNLLQESTLWSLFAYTPEDKYHSVIFLFDASSFPFTKEDFLDFPPHIFGNFTGWQNPIPMQHWRPTDVADSQTKVDGIETFLRSTNSNNISNHYPMLYRYTLSFPAGSELVFKFLLPNGATVLGPNYSIVSDAKGEKMNYYKVQKWDSLTVIENSIKQTKSHGEDEDDIKFKYASLSPMLSLRKPSRIVLGIGDDEELAKMFGINLSSMEEERKRKEEEMRKRRGDEMGNGGNNSTDINGKKGRNSQGEGEDGDENLSEDEKRRRLRLLRSSNIPEIFGSKTSSHFHAGGRKIAMVRTTLGASEQLKARLERTGSGNGMEESKENTDGKDNAEDSTALSSKVLSTRVIGSFQGVKLMDSDAEQRIFDSDWREIQIADIERDPQKRLELKEILNKYKKKLRHIFRFYASSSGKEINFLNVMKFLNFCRICKFLDNRRITIGKLHDIFIRVNVNEEYIEEEEKGQGAQTNPIQQKGEKEEESKENNNNPNENNDEDEKEDNEISEQKKNDGNPPEANPKDSKEKEKDAKFTSSLLKSLNSNYSSSPSTSTSSLPSRPQFQLKQPDQLFGNPDNAFIRGEFYESLIRISGLKFPKMSLSSALEKLLTQYVLPHAMDQDSTSLRLALLDDQVATVLAEYAEPLFSVFIYYAGADKNDVMTQHNFTINVKEYLQFLDDFKLIDHKLSRVKALQAFALSQEEEIIETMKESNKLSNNNNNNNAGGDGTGEVSSSLSSSSPSSSSPSSDDSIHLTTTYEMVFPEFLELLARLSSKRYAGKGELHHQMSLLFHFLFKGEEERKRKEKEKMAEREKEMKEKEKRDKERKKKEKEKEKEVANGKEQKAKDEKERRGKGSVKSSLPSSSGSASSNKKQSSNGKKSKS